MSSASLGFQIVTSRLETRTVSAQSNNLLSAERLYGEDCLPVSSNAEYDKNEIHVLYSGMTMLPELKTQGTINYSNPYTYHSYPPVRIFLRLPL